MAERAFLELLYGKGAHANPVACIEDVSFELAGKTIADYPHSIWQILSHMNYWMEFELKRIRSERPAYPAHAAESWLAQSAPPNEEEWRQAAAKFSSLLDDFAKLAESSPEALSQEVEAYHPNHAKYASSGSAILWQILVHNSYHIGQITVLRRALGAWPPHHGGDTW